MEHGNLSLEWCVDYRVVPARNDSNEFVILTIGRISFSIPTEAIA